MDCRDVEQLIDSYLDRELPGAAAEAFDRHLEACSRCQDRHGALLAFLSQPGEVCVPAGLRDRVIAAAAATANEASRSGGVVPTEDQPLCLPRLMQPAWIGLAAACLLVCFTGFITLRLGAGHGGLGAEDETATIPTPGVVAGYAQAAMRGPWSPAAVMLHAAAIDGLLQRPDEAAFNLPRRARLQPSPPEAMPPVPEMSLLLRLSTLGV